MSKSDFPNSRHFMGIGAQALPSTFPVRGKFINSFVETTIPGKNGRQHDVLPDIYTTCPELKKFKSLVSESPPLIQGSEADEQRQFQKMAIQVQMIPTQQTVPIAPTYAYHQPMIQPIMMPQSPIVPQFFQNFDPNALILRPNELSFAPVSEWPQQYFSLHDLRQVYFTRRNGAGRRFDFKLFNALRITKAFPGAYPYVGAIWVSSNLIKIHADIFASLLGIHAVQGGLFHKQGNFSRHGFTPVLKENNPVVHMNPNCGDVDDYTVRVFTDSFNRFTWNTEFKFIDNLPGHLDE